MRCSTHLFSETRKSHLTYVSGYSLSRHFLVNAYCCPWTWAWLIEVCPTLYIKQAFFRVIAFVSTSSVCVVFSQSSHHRLSRRSHLRWIYQRHNLGFWSCQAINARRSLRYDQTTYSRILSAVSHYLQYQIGCPRWRNSPRIMHISVQAVLWGLTLAKTGARAVPIVSLVLRDASLVFGAMLGTLSVFKWLLMLTRPVALYIALMVSNKLPGFNKVLLTSLNLSTFPCVVLIFFITLKAVFMYFLSSASATITTLAVCYSEKQWSWGDANWFPL
jgi:hypothetical protein